MFRRMNPISTTTAKGSSLLCLAAGATSLPSLSATSFLPTGSTTTAAVFGSCRSVVNYPTPSNSDNQHANSCPRQRIKGLDVNRLSYFDEVAHAPSNWQNPVEHTTWDLNEAAKVEVNHKEPNDFVDTLAYYTVQAMRFSFDLLAGFKFGRITEYKFINRCLFLETVAGVPGMVAGMLRHMTSLRRMERDHGWIHTLLEEAENERMHLLTFLEMRKPGLFFRLTVLLTQGIFFNVFMMAYIISPRFCHRLVGYIEEEAVKTYTHILEMMDEGKLPMFAMARCPPLAINYWKLQKDATFRDLIVAIRADEAGHRLVNHTFADMHAHNMKDGSNPFVLHHAKTMSSTSSTSSAEQQQEELSPSSSSTSGFSNSSPASSSSTAAAAAGSAAPSSSGSASMI